MYIGVIHTICKKKFDKVLQIAADISCQGGGQFSAHLSYLGHTVPAINWTGSSQPAEVRSRTGDRKSTSDKS